MRRTARLLFWLGLLAVAVVTLAPIESRPVTGQPPQFERFGAFLAVAVAMMIGYPKRRGLGFCALLIAAGVLELSQHLVTGRHGRWHDFEAKAAGVMAGALLGLAWEAARSRVPR